MYKSLNELPNFQPEKDLNKYVHLLRVKQWNVRFSFTMNQKLEIHIKTTRETDTDEIS